MPNHLNACRHMQAHAHLSRYVQTQHADTWIALPTHAEYMKHERADMFGKWELQYEEKSVCSHAAHGYNAAMQTKHVPSFLICGKGTNILFPSHGGTLPQKPEIIRGPAACAQSHDWKAHEDKPLKKVCAAVFVDSWPTSRSTLAFEHHV